MSSAASPVNRRRHIACKVLLLDDSVQVFHLPNKSLGGALFNEIARKLQLLESDYFDIQYTDVRGVTCWLDHEKSILRQVPQHNLDFRFVVKFYSPDPGLLEEEYTRYLFALQIKRDLATGAMPCQEHTSVLLASFIVQAMFGDFSEAEFVPGYLRMTGLLPHQSSELEAKIAEHHREHFGQSPAEADLNLLETARKVELYGIQMHAAWDHEGVALHLAVAHMGILVYQSYTKINTFSWAKIRKLSFKRKKFLIKLHPEGYGYYKDTVEFFFESRNACKSFWKKCLEHHGFFRCHAVKRLPRNRTHVVSRGSSFRYSGRTQKQLVEYVRENFVKRPPFQRSISLRTMSTGPSGAATPRTGTLNSHDIPPTESHAASATSSAGGASSVGGSYNLPASPSSSHNGAPPSYNRALKGMMGGQGGFRGQAGDRYDTPLHSETASVHRSEQMTSTPVPSPRAVSPPVAAARPEKLDMSQFVLSRDRNCSSPVFPVASPRGFVAGGDGGGGARDDGKLPRATPVDDIPKHLLAVGPESTSTSLSHSQSATVPDSRAGAPGLGLSSSPGVETARSLEQIVEQLQAELGVNSEERRSQGSGLNLTAENINFEQSPVGSPRSARPIAFDVRQQRVPQGDQSGSHNGTSLAESKPPIPPPILTREEDNRVRHRRRPLSDDSGPPRSVTAVTYSSNGSIVSARTDDSDDSIRKKVKPGRAYYVAKELVMTERTYVKDLSVITVWFRNAMSQSDVTSTALTDELLGVFDDFYDFHSRILKHTEQRLALWEAQETRSAVNCNQCRMGDLMLNALSILPMYESYMGRVEQLMLGLDSMVKDNPDMEQLYRDFEMQKVCYLPLNTFLLKPSQRLLHYQLILDNFLQCYPPDHPDTQSCSESLRQISKVVRAFSSRLPQLDNEQKLLELQQDLIGINTLLQPTREFVREGCLQKLSRKGYQQRMFFLFSDVLLYTSRMATQSLLFKVHGQLPVAGMTVEETDDKIAVGNSFAVYSGNRCLLVAASCEGEKAKWLEDLDRVIAMATAGSRERNGRTEPAVLYPSLKSNSSSEAMDGDSDAPPPAASPSALERGQIQHRTNTLMHVCWHRNTSVSMKERSTANRKLLSGFLLRKFKTNNDWQRLWVVFTNFCLFFYKSYRDDFPLASLPLLGYSVQLPAPADNISEELVFKLQFKNHVYFFRAESTYTFERWIEVISAATGTSHHMRLFSRLDSAALGTNTHANPDEHAV